MTIAALSDWLPHHITAVIWSCVDSAENFVGHRSPVSNTGSPTDKGDCSDAEWSRKVRRWKLGEIHRFFSLQDRSNDRARQMLEECTATKRFTLYLRGFNLSANKRFLRPEFRIEKNDEVAVHMRFEDLRFQERLVGCDFLPPLVSIENPQEVMTFEGISKLRVGAEGWEGLVRELARRSGLTVILVESPRAGVFAELTILAELGLQARTVIVTSRHNDVLSRVADMLAGGGDDAAEVPTQAWDDLIGRFPNRLELAHENFMAEFKRRARSILEQTAAEPYPEEKMIIPTSPRTTEEGCEAAIELASVYHVLAGKVEALKAVDLAEDHLFCAFAFACFADDSRLRASIILDIARLVNTPLGEAKEAVPLFEFAVELYDRLNVPEMIITARQECATALLACGELERSRETLLTAIITPSPAVDEWRDFCIWHTMLQIEAKLGNFEGANEARQKAMKAYRDFRAAGNAPKRLDAKAIAGFAAKVRDFYVSARVRAPILGEQALAALNQIQSQTHWLSEDLFNAVRKYVCGECSEAEVMRASPALDETFESLNLLYMLMHSSPEF